MTEKNFPDKPIPPKKDVIENVDKLEPQIRAMHERLRPAIRLYTYNFYRKNNNPTPEELSAFTETWEGLNARETEASAQPIPTIGTEIEWYIPENLRDTLTQLSIPNEAADDENPSDPLWEIKLPWTHSSSTQAFMIAQLRELGALDISLGNGATHMGLHINLAAPEDMTESDLTDPDATKRFEDTVDALTISYITAGRLLERKTKKSFSANKETDESQQQDTKEIVYRLELRTSEVLDDDVSLEHLLSDSQLLSAGAFQAIRKSIPRIGGVSYLESGIAEEFDDFALEVETLRTQKDFRVPRNFADTATPEQISQIMTSEETVQMFRGLVQDTSSRIQDFVDPSRLDDE